MSARLRQAFTGIVAVAGIVALPLSVNGAKPEPRNVPADQVDAVLRELWAKAVPGNPPGTPGKDVRDWQMKLTTWLPSEWPPSPRTVWTQYAYGLDVTLDGAAGVSAPFARIERHPGNDASRVVIPMESRVKSVATHPVRPHGGWRYTLEDEKQIFARTLSATSAPSDTGKISAYYHSWQLGNAEIAGQVASRHRAFFDWLKAEPQSGN